MNYALPQLPCGYRGDQTPVTYLRNADFLVSYITYGQIALLNIGIPSFFND